MQPDIQTVKCNNCENIYYESELAVIEDMQACPQCIIDGYLMDITPYN